MENGKFQKYRSKIKKEKYIYIYHDESTIQLNSELVYTRIGIEHAYPPSLFALGAFARAERDSR